MQEGQIYGSDATGRNNGATISRNIFNALNEKSKRGAQDLNREFIDESGLVKEKAVSEYHRKKALSEDSDCNQLDGL